MRRTVHNILHVSAALSTVILVMGAIPAYAETPVNADTAPVPSSGGVNGEIVVTATKRAERLRDIPASISTISGDTLEKQQITSATGLQDYVPSVAFTDVSGTKSIFIRGAGGGGRNAGFDPRVGVYVDGVYMAGTPAVDAALLDLARVEILRGPQGFLFGENTDAGAINFVTAAPTNDLSLRVNAGYGNNNHLTASAVTNVPIAPDAVLLRLTAMEERSDGFTRNLYTGKFVDGLNNQAFRGRLRVVAVPDLTLDLSADYSQQRTHLVEGEERTDAFGIAPVTTPPFVVDQDHPDLDLDESGGVSLTAAYKAQPFDITSITAYRKSYRHWVLDTDHTALPILWVDYRDHYRTISQELRITSRDATAPLRYLAGAYFSDNHDVSNRAGTFESFATLLLGIPAGATSVVVPDVESKTYAIYGSADLRLAQGLTLSAGVRAERIVKHLLENQNSLQVSPPLASPTFSNYRDRLTETTVSPTASLKYEPTRDLMVYLRYARGYKPGGFNADSVQTPVVPPTLAFAKERADAFEGGVKLSALDKRVDLTLAFFYNFYNDYQVEQFGTTSSGLVYTAVASAGKVHSYGPEFDLRVSPVEGLSIDANGAYLDSYYASFVNGGGVGIDYTGNQVEYAPKWTISVSADYSRTAPWSDEQKLFAGGHFNYRSMQYTTAADSNVFMTRGYELFDAEVGVEKANHWRLSFYGKNLFNKLYDTSMSLDGFGVVVGQRGLPRTYGFQATLDF